MSDSLRLGREWLTIASRLAIECVAPFAVDFPDGSRFEFACLLPQFGGKLGMLLMADFYRPAALAASDLGYGVSCLGAGDPEYPDLDSAIRCLNDWTWTSSACAPPHWYK